MQPASSTDGNGRPASVPEGARIRLKRDVVLPKPRDPITGKLIKLTKQQQRMADAIVACLRTYGAIVVDRAAVPTLYAQRVTDNLIQGNELQGLTLDDFEVLPIGRTPLPARGGGRGHAGHPVRLAERAALVEQLAVGDELADRRRDRGGESVMTRNPRRTRLAGSLAVAAVSLSLLVACSTRPRRRPTRSARARPTTSRPSRRRSRTSIRSEKRTL